MAEKNQMRTENIKKASELFKDGKLETLIKSSAKFESEAISVKRALEEKLKALETAKKQAEQQAVVVEEPVVVEAVLEPEVKGPKLKNGKRQFNLIMPTELYDQLQTAAAEDDRSLNSFIVLALKKFIAQNG